MNISVRFSTFGTLENHEVFLLNIHGRIYMGWKESDLIYRSIDSRGTPGKFNVTQIEAERDIVVIGTTDKFIDAQHYALFFVGEYPANGRAGTHAAIDTLQGMAAMRLAVRAAGITHHLDTHEL